MSKDILVVRLSRVHDDFNDYEDVINDTENYTIVVIRGENDTDRTEFEIIKYNG